MLISIVDGEEKLYSERMACVNCGINVPPLGFALFLVQFSLRRVQTLSAWAR